MSLVNFTDSKSKYRVTHRGEINKRARARYHADKDRHRASVRRYKEGSPYSTLQIALHWGLRRHPTINPISAKDLLDLWRSQNGKCALTGEIMTWRNGRICPTSLSIDRIDAAGGYTHGNVRLVCNWVNCARGKMSDAEFRERILALAERLK